MSDLDDATVREEFSRRRKRQWIASACAVAGIALAFLGPSIFGEVGQKPAEGPLVVVGIAVVIGVAIFSFKNWRCPRCGHYLGKRMFLRFCTSCGAQFTR